MLRLLDRLKAPPVDVPRALPGDLEALGRVRLDLEAPRPVAEVLRLLGDPVGAAFELPPGTGEEPVLPAAGTRPFFTVLDEVAGAAGLVARAGFDPSGRLRLDEGSLGQPWAAAGPLRVRVSEIGTSRTLGGPERRQIMLTIDVDWTPGVQVVSWQTPSDVLGVDAAGDRYTVGPASARTTTYGVGRASTGGRFQLHLQPEGEARARLATLDFRLPVRLRHDRREVRFEGPFEGGPREHAPTEGESVVLESVEPPPVDGGPWAAGVAARLDGPVATESVEVWFERADGRRQVAFAGTRFPSSDGRLQLSGRAHLGRTGAPSAVVVVFYRQEEQGEVALHLEDVPLR